MVKKPEEKDELDKSPQKKKLPPAAVRALEEAERRRNAQKQNPDGSETEVGGRGGLDPIRYGDWEKDGTASDF